MSATLSRIALPEPVRVAIREVEDAAMDCGEWPNGTQEDYASVADRLREARAALEAALRAWYTGIPTTAQGA